MAYQPYLLFNLSGSRYGIAAQAVQELFLLPAVTPIAEAVAEMVGILNLRGHIIPIVDLKQRLGRSRQPYTLKHAVLLITCQGQSVGVIVDEVDNVEFIAETDVATDLSSHLLTDAEHALTAGLAKHDAQLVTLLNPEALMRGAVLSAPVPPTGPPAVEGTVGSNEFLAQFSAADQAVLQRRADSLISQSESESLSGLTALAIVGLQGEHFALGLEAIAEFTDVKQITPIPCCPRHIVGNMNQRGEILTLVDIRQFLHLDCAQPSRQQKAVIVRVDEIVAGIIVDEVFDVMYIRPSDIAGIPTAIHAAENEYLRGVTAYGDRMMSILDLPKLLTHGELEVEQAA
jgi:purine-binding chemotaxis protein CheW